MIKAPVWKTWPWLLVLAALEPHLEGSFGFLRNLKVHYNFGALGFTPLANPLTPSFATSVLTARLSYSPHYG